MHKDEIGREWYGYVRSNYHKLKEACKVISTEKQMLETRRAWAEMGYETTPDELRKFEQLLRETLEIVENNIDLNQ
jgi:hypothetical protein